MKYVNDLKSFLRGPKGETILHVGFWLFFFTSIHTNWTGHWLDASIRPSPPAPLTVMYFPIFFYLNAFWMIPRFLKQKGWIIYFSLAIPVFAGPELLRAAATVNYIGYEGSFWYAVNSEIYARDSFLFGWISVAWLTFIASFGYRFTLDWIKNNQRIERLESEKMAMELNLIKSQINPHFLFNNLNALDDLIDQDKKAAKTYLHKLSKLYRYLIQNMDKDVVTLKEEWDFVDDYTFLLKERFGDSYLFRKSKEIENLSDYFIPPATLQSLVENAVKHNQGSIEDPLEINIDLNVQGLQVSNKKRPKQGNTKTLGTGLKNLKSRFLLLSNEEIQISDTDLFSVVLPLIKGI